MEHPFRPAQRSRTAPCQAGCLAGADVRGWIATIAQRRRLGLSDEQAFEQAWRGLVVANPFPAVMGRICPHPCESGCNRSAKDGAVSINSLERFLGDWALAHELELEPLDGETVSESVGVIGAGPAGLSFAYQMARRGYATTVYDHAALAGGMLRYGVPEYRLPRRVLDAEIDRIVELGVELRLSTRIGADVTLERLQARHDAIFLGIGAQRGLAPDWYEEDEQGVWLATDYLRSVHAGETSDLGRRVVVVGGGNTAIDAARTARRHGAEVRLLYRRSPAEMPARAEEVEEAREEGIGFEFLAAPLRLERERGRLCGVVVQRMQLGEPDASGRRRPQPVAGAIRELPADAVIAAVSQAPDWTGLTILRPEGERYRPGPRGRLTQRLWAGGDVVEPGAAGQAIGRGRAAAEALHAQLRGRELPPDAATPTVSPEVKAEFYPSRPLRADVTARPVSERMESPEIEAHLGISEESFLDEVARCMSCGECFGCEHCWLYCAHECFSRLEQPRPGAYFALATEGCESCGKCADLCPCGFLGPQEGAER